MTHIKHIEESVQHLDVQPYLALREEVRRWCTLARNRVRRRDFGRVSRIFRILYENYSDALRDFENFRNQLWGMHKRFQRAPWNTIVQNQYKNLEETLKYYPIEPWRRLARQAAAAVYSAQDCMRAGDRAKAQEWLRCACARLWLEPKNTQEGLFMPTLGL